MPEKNSFHVRAYKKINEGLGVCMRYRVKSTG
jgi:hypothetical protein